MVQIIRRMNCFTDTGESSRVGFLLRPASLPRQREPWIFSVYGPSGCLKSEGAVLNESEYAVTGKAVRRDRKAESRKLDGMGAADERLQGTGRGDCESGIDLRLSEEVRAENCSDFSHIVQSCGRIAHKFYGII